MNTVEEDTVWKPACPQLAMFMKASKDYIADPKSVLNVVFEETSSEHYITITKCFPSWSIFCNWVFDCPVKGAIVSASAPGEELYACYFKEFPGQREDQVKEIQLKSMFPNSCSSVSDIFVMSVHCKK